MSYRQSKRSKCILYIEVPELYVVNQKIVMQRDNAEHKGFTA